MDEKRGHPLSLPNSSSDSQNVDTHLSEISETWTPTDFSLQTVPFSRPLGVKKLRNIQFQSVGVHICWDGDWIWLGH